MWHKHGVKPPHSSRREPRGPRPPLVAATLDALALHYVGRFATSRRKLRDYLGRKLRERGWGGDTPADLEAIADRLAALGYIDDAAFAVSKARVMSGRGLGGRRVAQALHGAGISDDDRELAQSLVEEERIEAALRHARKRRIGPFATAPLDPAQREKAVGAMIRAGHGFSLSRAIVMLAPGEVVDMHQLAEIR